MLKHTRHASMLSDNLQANKQYLAELINAYSNSDARKIYASKNFDRVITDIIDDIENQNSPKKAWGINLFKRILARDHFVDNPFIEDNLIPACKRIMKSEFSDVANIPVGFLPSITLNGFVSCGKKRECAIVLNDHLGFYSENIFKAYLGYYTWWSSTPFSREYSQKAFGVALIGLALYNARRNEEYLKWFENVAFMKANDFEEHVDNASYGILLFILLHEYAHIVKGHLDYSNTSKLSIATNVSVTVFKRDQNQEFEADIVAIQWFLSNNISNEERLFFIRTIGVLMRFLALSEAFRKHSPDTHPPAIDRWKRIKEQNEIMENIDSSVISEVDKPFDSLVENLISGGILKRR